MINTPESGDRKYIQYELFPSDKCSVQRCNNAGECTPIIIVENGENSPEFFMYTVKVCNEHRLILPRENYIPIRMWNWIRDECNKMGFEASFDSVRLEFENHWGVRLL